MTTTARAIVIELPLPPRGAHLRRHREGDCGMSNLDFLVEKDTFPCDRCDAPVRVRYWRPDVRMWLCGPCCDRGAR